MERYDFIWLLMSATEGNEEVKDGFLAVLVVLSEGKLDPAASPPRPLLLCPPSVSHFKLQESHQLQLLLFACVLDHCPGRCPANSGGYLVLSFHFLKGPFEYSSTLKQCATCPSFPSRNSAWSFKLPSLRGVCGACGGQLVACDLPATALPRRCVKRTTTFCGDVHGALKWLSEATG